MRRRAFIAGLLAATAGSSIDLGACGDKFLRIGRSARFRRYAAVHPAAILIYSPANSTQAGLNDLKALLKRAGHKAVAIERNASVSEALAAMPFDVLIADYSDTSQLKADLQATASHAALLPILYKPSKDVEAEAMREYRYLIKPHAMSKYDALAEIDRLMDSGMVRTAAPK
jgi:hypothetical protein